jgi:hypothetical protein
MASGWNFLPILYLCPISIIPPVIPTHLHLKNLEKDERASAGNCETKWRALERILGSYLYQFV